jgi:hypothetical protein
MEYRLHLCQSEEGKRFFRLVSIGSEADKARAADVFLATGVVPNSLLKKRDILSIAKTVRLEDGQKYIVDAHGIWFTESEIKEMDSGRLFSKIHWISGREPHVPDR